MKTVLLVILFAAIPTIRAPLSGPARIDGAHTNQAIAVLVTPNDAIFSSDEIQPDPVLKWKRVIPVVVYRLRAIALVNHVCQVQTLRIEISTAPQVFVIPATSVKEFDSFVFEHRPWYSITTSISSPVGAGPQPIDGLLSPTPFPGPNVYDCN